jgi:hypothetical protein
MPNYWWWIRTWRRTRGCARVSTPLRAPPSDTVLDLSRRRLCSPDPRFERGRRQCHQNLNRLLAMWRCNATIRPTSRRSRRREHDGTDNEPGREFATPCPTAASSSSASSRRKLTKITRAIIPMKRRRIAARGQ